MLIIKERGLHSPDFTKRQDYSGSAGKNQLYLLLITR
jgi:hypothetical protein